MELWVPSLLAVEDLPSMYEVQGLSTVSLVSLSHTHTHTRVKANQFICSPLTRLCTWARGRLVCSVLLQPTACCSMKVAIECSVLWLSYVGTGLKLPNGQVILSLEGF